MYANHGRSLNRLYAKGYIPEGDEYELCTADLAHLVVSTPTKSHTSHKVGYNRLSSLCDKFWAPNDNRDLTLAHGSSSIS